MVPFVVGDVINVFTFKEILRGRCENGEITPALGLVQDEYKYYESQKIAEPVFFNMRFKGLVF